MWARQLVSGVICLVFAGMIQLMRTFAQANQDASGQDQFFGTSGGPPVGAGILTAMGYMRSMIFLCGVLFIAVALYKFMLGEASEPSPVVALAITEERRPHPVMLEKQQPVMTEAMTKYTYCIYCGTKRLADDLTNCPNCGASSL